MVIRRSAPVADSHKDKMDQISLDWEKAKQDPDVMAHYTAKAEAAVSCPNADWSVTKKGLVCKQNAQEDGETGTERQPPKL